MAVVSFKKDGIRYLRKYFVSYPDSVMVMKFIADKPGMQNLIFSYSPNTEAKGRITPTGTNELCYLGELNNNKMKFAFRIRAINRGGTATATNDGRIIIKDADEVIFLLTADTDYKMNFHPDFKDPKTYDGRSCQERV